jgi:hypothetical protein
VGETAVPVLSSTGTLSSFTADPHAASNTDADTINTNFLIYHSC